MEIKENRYNKRLNILATECLLQEIRDASIFFKCSISHFVRECVKKGIEDYKMKKAQKYA